MSNFLFAIISSIVVIGVILLSFEFARVHSDCQDMVVERGTVKAIYYQPRGFRTIEKWSVVTDKDNYVTFDIPPLIGEDWNVVACVSK